MIRASFDELPIASVCTRVTSGSTPLRSRNDFYEGGTIDWFKTGELNDWYVESSTEKVTPAALGETSLKVFPPNTVLMAMYGDGRTITTLGMLRQEAATNQACAAMLVDPKVCLPRYFFYALKSRRHKLIGLALGGAQRNLSAKIIKEFCLPIPNLAEQRRIASTLSAYDDLIENCQRRIRILEDMARGLYREWFIHFRFPGADADAVPRVDSPLGPIPQGWGVRPFTDIAEVWSGGTPKTDMPAYWDGEIPFFTPRDAPACFYVQDTGKRVTEAGLSKCASALYAPDTVFITARGTVGKVALAAVPMAMNQSCYALRGKDGFSQRYLFLLTLTQVDYLKTNTGGATFDTIVVETFRRMLVAVPPTGLVSRFTGRVDGLFEQVNVLQQKITNLRRTRDLLLPRLLSGQIALPAAEAAASA